MIVSKGISLKLNIFLYNGLTPGNVIASTDILNFLMKVSGSYSLKNLAGITSKFVLFKGYALKNNLKTNLLMLSRLSIIFFALHIVINIYDKHKGII